MNSPIQGQMARGALWMLLFKLSERSLGLISTLILVRLLSPHDFGLVAMATAFIAMAELLSAFGFDIALIQNQRATERHYNAAWTGNVILGTAITLIMLIAASPISRFYGEPDVFWVVCILAFGPALGALENIGVVAFRKELRFRSEFLYQLCRKLVAFCVTVPLAFALRNYWALVAGAIASRAAATAISYIAHPFRPRFSLAEIGSLLGFSRWLLLNNVITFFKERTSDFLVGRLHGATTLGVYSISYELANMPMTELSAPVNRALLPGFAKLGDADEASALYAKTVGMLAFVAVPAAGGIFAVAPFLVPALLGPKWLAATAVIEVLAFNGALLLFHSGICAMLIARGFPRQVTITNAVYVAILVLGLALTVPQFGAIGAAHAALTASVLSTPVYLAHVYRRLRVSPLSLLRAVARPVLAAAVMIVVVRSALPAFELSLSASAALGLLLGGITLGIAVYAVAGFLLWLASGRPDGPERFLLTRAMAWLTGLARRGRHRAS